jgi:acyl carrier protein
MKPRSVIIDLFNEALEVSGSQLTYNEIKDDTVLLNSGLDSLGFAILVARLEEELGFDPFVEMEEAVYPTTFGEFVAIYEKRSCKDCL